MNDIKNQCTCETTKIKSLDSIPLGCPKAYAVIELGLTKGIFQLDSYLGKKWGKLIKPKNINDLSDLISLTRPGALESGMLDKYYAIKEGQLEVEYLHQDLKPILEQYHGQLIYQESVLEICCKIAGMSLLEADQIRAAMGKKNPELQYPFRR